MNIVMFSDSFYPNIGGVEKHILKICEKLIQRGDKITVITKNKKIDADSFAKKDKYNGIDIYYLNYRGKKDLFKVWQFISRNNKLFKESDKIHFHDFYCLFFWFLPFSMRYKNKIFVTFHGYESFPIKKRYIFYRKICELIAKDSIAIGEYINIWYGQNIKNINYGGCDILQKDVNKDSDIAYIGRLDPDSYIYRLIEYIDQNKDKVDIDIYGKGTQLSKIIHKEFVHYCGEVRNVEKVLPAYKICFANGYLSILEGLFSKCIVFCYYDNALKKDYYLKSSLAKYIHVYDDLSIMLKDLKNVLKNYQSCSKNINEFNQNEYTWEKVIELYDRVWNK